MLLTIVAVWTSLHGSAAVATMRSWNTNSSGNFNDAGNWDTKVPVSGDTAQFSRGAAATYTVTFPGDLIINPTRTYTNERLVVGNNTVTFARSASHQLGPAKYALTDTTTVGDVRGIIVGDAPTDTVAILETGLVSLSAEAATIGNQSGSVGTLVVDGGVVNVTGSTSAAPALYVGRYGTGYLYILDGGQVNLTGSYGSVDVGSGQASSSVHISGVGSLLSVQGREQQIEYR